MQSELNFGLSFEHLDFNFNNEHLKDLKVRQAIATGLDVQQLTADRQRPGSSRRWPSGSPT